MKYKVIGFLLVIIFLFGFQYQEKVDATILAKNDKSSILKNFEKAKGKVSYKMDEIVVRFHNPNSIDFKALEEKYAIKISKNLGLDSRLVKFKTTDYTMEEILTLLNSESVIASAEPDYAMKVAGSPTTEPYYSNLWGLKNMSYGYDINIESAWDISLGSNSVVVGVIDSGIDYQNPDLNDNVWINSSEIPDNLIDDDANGYIDDYYGWDFHNQDSNPMDDNGHGTHVAGIIASENNGIGTVGVAPNVKLMALKAGGSEGTLYVSSILNAIQYGLDQGVKVFNLSFAGDIYISSMDALISSSDALFICAAGNDSVDNDITPSYPASYTSSNIISVASISNDGSLSSFSNYGVYSVDVAAPGDYILSTVLNNKYQYYSGTSMATPYVTGLTALLLSQDKFESIDNVRTIILNQARPLSSLAGKVKTGSIIDSYQSLYTLLNSNFTVTYNGNGATGGSIPTDSNTYDTGEMVTILDNVGSLIKSGYHFISWNDQMDGLGNDYIPNNTFAMPAQNVTLYAKWALSLDNPINLLISNLNHNSLTLNWDSVTNATQYEVYRSSSLDGEYVLISKANNNSYMDTNLVTGSTYYYKVRAAYQEESVTYYSEYSSIITAKPYLTIPSLVNAFSLEYDRNKTSWNAVLSASGY